MSFGASISGWGKYIPERVLANGDLEAMVKTTDEWIQERTGIRQRHIAADYETASSMGIYAGRQALQKAGLRPEDIDLIIVATCTPDGMLPAVAPLVQHGLGASRAAAFDINAACSGFVPSLATAAQFIASGAYQRVLVVGTEVLSRIVDWTDRGTCVLFADGAGAVVLERSPENRILSFVLGSDGSKANIIYAPGPCGPRAATPSDNSYYVHMNGSEVFRSAVEMMTAAAKETVAKAGLSIDDVSLFIPHQANLRIINAVARSLHLGKERIFTNVDLYGNTSAASIPIALCEAAESCRLKRGDKVVIAAVGGGLSWGAMLLEW